MTARSVSIRFGCFLFAAGITLSAQYSAEFTGPTTDPSGRPLTQAERQHAMLTSNWIPSGAPNIPRDTNTNMGGIISVKHLAHAVPSKAQKEYDKANAALAKNELDQVKTHLERAVEIDPEFVEAVNDLGAAYARQGKTDLAIKQFEKAADLDSKYAPAFYNMSLMFLGQERLDDAARAARTAIDIDPSHVQSRLVLGMALVFGDQFTDEAVLNLRRCTDAYPQAHLFLARALAGRGEKATARSEIETYLATGDTTGRELAKSWLQALR